MAYLAVIWSIFDPGIFNYLCRRALYLRAVLLLNCFSKLLELLITSFTVVKSSAEDDCMVFSSYQ